MDREKVIKGVHDTRRYLEDREWVDKSVGVHIDALNDALALLTDQDAVEPKKVKGYNPPMYTLYEYECEECKSPMMNKQPFCMGCGRSVNWK